MDLGPDEQRVAIVSGGGRGIGRSIVLGLARSGVHVIATVGRERREIEAVARETQDLNAQASVVPLVADVTKPSDCEIVVDAAVKRFGRLDILVNNAGRGMKHVSDSFMAQPTRFWEIEAETWRLIVDTNVNGPFLMARAAVPVMLRTGWGRIINISVSRETMRRRGFSPYGPSKAALESETIIWSQELQGTGVTVNALLPGGATRTGMVPDSVPDEVRSNFLDPDVMVPPLLWLISQDADKVTGQRFVATKWSSDLPGRQAGEAAAEIAGW
ncbi:MAG TPA: SDR family oxidoreductase [Candidatus Acidoferrum sp.]|nr:SDR family oxidoreductase [Candidatus Acidoferrum sp.]